jgi:H+-transporting ATPase
MATTDGATGTHSSNTSDDNPHHLNTNIESGTFDEKAPHDDHPPTKEAPEDEEDEDMDALIDELESQDGHAEDEEEGETVNPGTGRVVPEDQLQTDTRIGLTEAEVHARRKKYGLNQMKEEKENLILKFLGYFIGPIQFVMEVCFPMPIFFLSVLVSAIILLALPACFSQPRRTRSVALWVP